MAEVLQQTRVPSIFPKGRIKLAAIGEGPGKDEDLMGEPWVGAAGQLFKEILADAGLNWKEMFLGNLVSHRPPKNRLEALCIPRRELTVEQAHGAIQIYRGKFLHPFLQEEIERLRSELLSIKPNLVLALGAAPMAVLTGQLGITKSRGSITESTLVPGLKVLGTFHPAGVLRNWKWRVTVLADFIKAKREMEFPEIVRPKRTIWIDPTLKELEMFEPKLLKAKLIALDIETARGQITCISFAPSPKLAIVVPFVDKASPDYSYWKTAADEFAAWKWVKRMCALPVPKVLQNGVYDYQWLIKMGIPIHNYYQDTLLLHHSLYPELPKGLGFLGSIYTNEASWKLYSPRGYKSGKSEDVT